MKNLLGLVVFIGVSALLFPQGGKAADGVQTVEISAKHEFTIVRLADGLANPWALELLPDGRILVTERPGRLKVFADGRWSDVSGLPAVSAGGQGGLLDVVADRNFYENRTLYLTFAKAEGGLRGTAVARAVLDGSRLSGVTIIWEMMKKTAGGIHFGSRVRQLPDGTLLFTVGERGAGERAQDLSDGAGKTHRINPDGTIPADNPFRLTPGARPSVYSYGHRNPQGLAVHPLTGEIWLTEHGPQGGDEVNMVKPGANYGWPIITYGRQYGTGAPIGEGTSKPGMEQPLVYWTPSIAPSGLVFYTGSLFPGWRGNLFSGNLAGRLLLRMEVEGGRVSRQERLLEGAVGRIRDVEQGMDGLIYLLTDEADGGLYRIEPAD